MATAEEIERIVGRLVSWLHDDGQKPLRQAFAAWIRGVLSTAQSGHGAKDIRNVDDLLELKSMLHETVREWPRQWKAEGRQEGRQEGRREGRQEGRREGRQEGERDLLIRLLERRFGTLDSAARERLQAADRDRLGAWGTRLLDAETLDEIWGDEP